MQTFILVLVGVSLGMGQLTRPKPIECPSSAVDELENKLTLLARESVDALFTFDIVKLRELISSDFMACIDMGTKGNLGCFEGVDDINRSDAKLVQESSKIKILQTITNVNKRQTMVYLTWRIKRV